MNTADAEEALIEAQRIADEPDGAVTIANPTIFSEELLGHCFNGTTIRVTVPDADGREVNYVGTPLRMHYGSSGSVRRPYLDMEVFYLGKISFPISAITKLDASALDHEAALEAAATHAHAARTSVTLRDDAIRNALGADVPVERIAEVTELTRARIYQIRDGRR
jgi:phage FluMu protein gp41